MDYWTHNTAYHAWIIKQVKKTDRVLDVGCGDGLLVEKLSPHCLSIVGVEPHAPSAEKAKERLYSIQNATIHNVSFEEYDSAPESFDIIVFVASLHHMEQEAAIRKAKSLLSANGKLLIVGCAYPEKTFDKLVELLRVLPAKVGSIFHGEKNHGDIGVPIKQPDVSLSDVREMMLSDLPNAQMRQGLYYRYLLSWVK